MARYTMTVENGTHIILTAHEAIILDEFLADGADTETVARRVGYARNTVNRTLSDIARAFGLSRMEMVVAFLRGTITYRTRVSGDWPRVQVNAA